MVIYIFLICITENIIFEHTIFEEEVVTLNMLIMLMFDHIKQCNKFRLPSEYSAIFASTLFSCFIKIISITHVSSGKRASRSCYEASKVVRRFIQAYPRSVSTFCTIFLENVKLCS